MLPLGRKNSRKCSECNITCHANCVHLVPDFCGMSMETANILLRDWRDINKSRGDKTQTAPRKQLTMAESPTAAMDRMRIGVPEVPAPEYSRPPPPSDRYPPDPRYFPQQPQQMPPQMLPPGQAPYAPTPPPGRPPGGARAPVPPGYEQQQQQQGQQGRPPPGPYDPASALGPAGYPAAYPVMASRCDRRIR
jgi:hypothetical protein